MNEVAIIKSMLDEMTKRMDDPLPDLRPFIVALSDPLPRETRSKQAGITRKVTFDIDRDLYEHLQGLPDGCVVKGIVWLAPVEEGTAEIAPAAENAATAKPAPKKATKKKTEKEGSDEFGQFWYQFRLNVLHMEDVMTVLEIDDLDLWNEYLRIRYGQQSLRAVDPQLVIDELEGAGLRAAAEKCRAIVRGDGPQFRPRDLVAHKLQTEDDEFLAEHRMP